MEKKEFEKELNLILKEEFKKLSIENSKTKVTSKKVEFINNDNNGSISYNFQSYRFAGLGAITALTLSARFLESSIGKILNELKLDYNIPPYIGYSMTIPRYVFPKTIEYPEDQSFNFYPTKKERWRDLMFYIKDDILPRLNNYLNCKLETIDDIFSNQDYYKYPLTTILIILCLNKKQSQIEKYIDLAKTQKLYDAKDKILLETKDKVLKYFNL